MNCNRHPTVDEFHRFAFDHSGFVGTSKLLRKKHNELRGSIEHGLVGRRRSGETFSNLLHQNTFSLFLTSLYIDFQEMATLEKSMTTTTVHSIL